MAISTNSIIHYTNTFDKLKSILIEGFAIKYCAEELILDEENKSLAAHPMICFCDIPLSQSYRHFDAYGKYGIGLSKNWAKRLGINPVLYLDKNSSITKTLGGFLKERRNKSSNLTDDQKSRILRIKSFTKNYSGPLKRLDKNEKDYRFYDEREWRLVPESKDLNGAKFSISLTDYRKAKNKYNEKLSTIRYKFAAEDITYIIVERTTEISKLTKVVRENYSDKCTATELDILLSKICSANQIIEDY